MGVGAAVGESRGEEVKPTLFTPDSQEAQTLHAAAYTLYELPRMGAIAATSLRVERNGAASLVFHLESGEDVGVPRREGETWDEAIMRFNAEVPA